MKKLTQLIITLTLSLVVATFAFSQPNTPPNQNNQNNQNTRAPKGKYYQDYGMNGQETQKKHGVKSKNFGIVDPNANVSTSGSQLGEDGANFGQNQNSKQVKYNKKAKRLSLTSKERALLDKQKNSPQDLTPKEERKIRKINKKQDKLKKLNEKYVTQKEEQVATKNYELSPDEKQILKTDSAGAKLSLSQKLEIRKIKRKQKRLIKQKAKDSLSTLNETLTPREAELLEKSKNKKDTTELTREDKKILKSAKKKDKKRKKREEKIKKEQLRQQTWTAGNVSKFSFRRIFRIPMSKKAYERKKARYKKKQMSPYERKKQKITNKYKLNEAEMDAYNKGKSGMPLTLVQKMRFRRALIKKVKFKEKIKKLDKEAHFDNQSKDTQKMMKAREKEERKKRRKEQWKDFKYKVKKLVTPKKRYGRSNKRR